MSLPLRKCGLKQWWDRTFFPDAGHFPCGSVDWNYDAAWCRWCNAVTSLAEVWIETRMSRKPGIGKESLPLRKCGLKLHLQLSKNLILSHFPCGSVDWNNPLITTWYNGICHFPCGSVDWNLVDLNSLTVSFRVTSLAEVWIETLISAVCLLGVLVTSLAEVWIETRTGTQKESIWNVTSLAEVWIETPLLTDSIQLPPVTSLAEVWIETLLASLVFLFWICHFPCGSVDWNYIMDKHYKRANLVTSLAEVWIETKLCKTKCYVDWVTSLAEVWIETGPFVCTSNSNWVTSLAEVWIETSFIALILLLSLSHFPCGSVDWNTGNHEQFVNGIKSLPLRKCGLKQKLLRLLLLLLHVTSLAEVWIETTM